MDPFWEQNRPKIVPRRVLRPLLFENVDSHETSAGVVSGAFLGPQDGAKIDPRSPQDGLKSILKAIVFEDEFMIDFWSSWASSWLPLGSSWGFRVPSWERLGVLLGAQDGPKID